MDQRFSDRRTSMRPQKRLVDRIRKDPFFFGWALAEYEVANHLDDRGLAEWLECSIDALDRLALCRRPDDEAVRFRQDVRQSADLVGCNADRLVYILREIASVAALRRGANAENENDLLMAARDRKNPGETPGGEM